MSIETFRMPKNITRLFVGAIVAVGAALVLGFAALWAAWPAMQSTSVAAITST
jgi:uncharacterized membrane protein YphA (DoxX/SURF4 family)